MQIALRALAILKVGGQLSYSTCSLNPMEDESVVAALLLVCAGAVEVCILVCMCICKHANVQVDV